MLVWYDASDPRNWEPEEEDRDRTGPTFVPLGDAPVWWLGLGIVEQPKSEEDGSDVQSHETGAGVV